MNRYSSKFTRVKQFSAKNNWGIQKLMVYLLYRGRKWYQLLNQNTEAWIWICMDLVYLALIVIIKVKYLMQWLRTPALRWWIDPKIKDKYGLNHNCLIDRRFRGVCRVINWVKSIDWVNITLRNCKILSNSHEIPVSLWTHQRLCLLLNQVYPKEIQ